jgi:CubicO group peptidase (beta-lactamase class C family)
MTGPTTQHPGSSAVTAQGSSSVGHGIHGVVDDGYGPVMDEFARNFAERGDLGAACTIYVRGEQVVDVWAGIADRRTGRPWEADTSAVIFSCTKGVLAICAYLLVEQGLLDLDAPIAVYWPSFGQAGKEAITVRDAMTHRAAIPALEVDLAMDEVVAWHPVIKAIERQTPLFPAGSGHFYHALTYGWLLGEVIRRITGLMPGVFFCRAIAEPLGLRTWIGTPEAELSSVAWMEPPLADEDSEAAREAARIAAENQIVERSLTMGGAFAFPAEGAFVTFNDRAIQTAEIPGANGISTARSLAQLYAGCVSEIDGRRFLSPASIADATRVQVEGRQISGIPDDGARWGTGFLLASPPSQPMLGRTSFGHPGAGGQLAFGDVEHGVGLAYLSNQMGGYGDARARELTAALRRVLRA